MNKFIYPAAIAMLLTAGCGTSKKGTKPAGPVGAAPGAASPDKIKSIAEATKKTRKIEGLFTFYQDSATGSVMMLVKGDQLGKEFIYHNQSVDGPAGLGLNRGSFRENKVVEPRKYFNRIEFVSKNTNFYFDPENNLSKAASANISEGILFSGNLVGQDEAKKLYLIKADDLFISENLHQIKFPSFPGGGLPGFSLGSIAKDKSKYSSIKSFPKNSDVIIEYAFDNPAAFPMGVDPGITELRFVTIKMQHSFLEMPNNDFKPRFDDPRVGYFLEQVDDQTTAKQLNYRDLIHRWHLKKKNPDAPVSDPVEPIVYWIEKTTPQDLRPIIRKAAEKWNLAFEKAGFSNAFVVKDQPDTATWEADDIRYNVLRWTSSPNPPFGGYGPSFVNPRTGQILGADIMLEWVFVTNRINYDRLFAQATYQHNHIEELYEKEQAEAAYNKLKHNGMHCSLGHHLQMSAAVGKTHLKAAGASAEAMRTLVEESVYYLILHEIGHTFGLNHNMKASQLHSISKVNDANMTKNIGLTGSVMDYPAINIADDQARQGQFYTTRPGPYDMWAIEFGYSPEVSDPAQEAKRLKAILDRSTNDELTFGNDADDMRAPGKGIDPRVNVGDMTSDAEIFASLQIKRAFSKMKGLKEKYTTNGESWEELKNAFNSLIGEASTASGVVARYVGGVFVERGMAGQTGAKQPYTPVPPSRQKECMKILTNQVFAPNALQVPVDLVPYLATQRRGFNLYSSTEDPKVASMLLMIQANALAHITHPATLRRITDTELYGNTYNVNEVMNDLTAGIFAADAGGSVNPTRQNLQAFFVDRIISIAGLDNKSGMSPYTSRVKNAALAQVMAVQKIVASTAGDASTKAHRMALSLKIKQALEAK